jgi:fructose-bisphosphate aldolase class II
MVRHVIVFNATADHLEVLAMAERGQRDLGRITGVTDIRFGVAVDPAARYRYFFDIGFTDETIIASYRDDPVHVRFATEQFRPMAPDRLTVDYLLEGQSS